MRVANPLVKTTNFKGLVVKWLATKFSGFSGDA